jgi:predicted transcriptional regulator
LGSYRGKLDIIADILRVAMGNAKKTQIMYQANLSYKVLQRYLAEIIEASLISFEDKKHRYILTAKGREFLDAYQEYSKINRHVEKQLKDIRTSKRALERLISKKQPHIAK